jgi:pimeloyl-ACP methyl ester carboxylesterase
MPGVTTPRVVQTPDGHCLYVHTAEDGSAGTVVLHHGTPFSALPYEPFLAAAAERGLRYVAYSRPGYGSSSPHAGRTVADAVADVGAVLDSVGVGTFVTAGWSGGGPHALACAALLPDRCLAAATIAGVAPYDAGGLDWLAGMGQDNLDEFGAAAAGRASLERYLDTASGLARVTSPGVSAAFHGLLSAPDAASLVGDFADWFAASLRDALRTGTAGWRDDDLAFVAPWGFDLTRIVRPVAVWQGDQDRMVPFAHGRWLGSAIPGAETHLRSGEGHLSLAIETFGQVLDGLLAASMRSS